MSKENKDRSSSSLYRVVYSLCAGLVGFIFRVKVIGGENEPDKGGFIVCSNHTSATDPVVICYAFRKHQIRFMAKKELFKVPIVSWFVSLMGAYPVDRGGNDVGAIRKSVNMVKEGKCMGIFPQGHRYPEVDPRSTPTKSGMALIAVKSGATVVPTYIVRKDNKHRLFRRTWVVIGKPIPFSEFEFNPSVSGEYARITDIAFDRICSLGEEFSLDDAKARAKAEKRKGRSL